MSTYGDKLRQDKKIELSRKVSQSLAAEITEMSWMAKDEQEFVDYLMTITDQEAIEEFFNQCHDENGRFCGGGVGGNTGKGRGIRRGPGTHIPAPLDLVKQQIRSLQSTYRGRKSSEKVKGVTTSLVRSVLSGQLGAGGGRVKIKALQNANIKKFSNNDLKTVKTQLETDQRNYNTVRTLGLAFAVNFMPHAYGIARWKTNRIPGQIKRIDSELKGRGSKFEAMDIEEFADNGDMSIEQEIASLMKDRPAAPTTEPKLSKEQLEALVEFLEALDDDDDIPADIKAKAKKELS